MGLDVGRMGVERAPKVLGRARIVGLVDRDGTHAVMGAGVGRERERAGERRPRLGMVASGMANDAEQDRQFDRAGRQLDPVLDHRDGFIGLIGREQQIGELVKGVRVRRTPFGRASQSCRGILGAADPPQGDAELRLGGRILDGTDGALERSDRLSRPALLQQRAANNIQRLGMPGASGHDIPSYAFGLVRAPVVEGAHRPLQLRFHVAGGSARRARTSAHSDHDDSGHLELAG